MAIDSARCDAMLLEFCDTVLRSILSQAATKFNEVSGSSLY